MVPYNNSIGMQNRTIEKLDKQIDQASHQQYMHMINGEREQQEAMTPIIANLKKQKSDAELGLADMMGVGNKGGWGNGKSVLPTQQVVPPLQSPEIKRPGIVNLDTGGTVRRPKPTGKIPPEHMYAHTGGVKPQPKAYAPIGGNAPYNQPEEVYTPIGGNARLEESARREKAAHDGMLHAFGNIGDGIKAEQERLERKRNHGYAMGTGGVAPKPEETKIQGDTAGESIYGTQIPPLYTAGDSIYGPQIQDAKEKQDKIDEIMGQIKDIQTTIDDGFGTAASYNEIDRLTKTLEMIAPEKAEAILDEFYTDRKEEFGEELRQLGSIKYVVRHLDGEEKEEAISIINEMNAITLQLRGIPYYDRKTRREIERLLEELNGLNRYAAEKYTRAYSHDPLGMVLGAYSDDFGTVNIEGKDKPIVVPQAQYLDYINRFVVKRHQKEIVEFNGGRFLLDGFDSCEDTNEIENPKWNAIYNAVMIAKGAADSIDRAKIQVDVINFGGKEYSIIKIFDTSYEDYKPGDTTSTPNHEGEITIDELHDTHKELGYIFVANGQTVFLPLRFTKDQIIINRQDLSDLYFKPQVLNDRYKRWTQQALDEMGIDVTLP